MLDATPLLRLYARRRNKQLATEDPCQTQREQLLALVGKASRTRFGSDHRFSEIRDVTDFQQRVSLRRYEDFWREYWQPCFPKLVNVSWPGTIPYFALTSGTTTGKTKYIPFSYAMSASNQRATRYIPKIYGSFCARCHQISRRSAHHRKVNGCQMMYR